MKIRFKGNVKGPGEITLAFEPGEEREITLSEPNRLKREEMRSLIKQFNDAHNTVTIDRGLLKDTFNALNELLHPNDYVRELTRALDATLNKAEKEATSETGAS